MAHDALTKLIAENKERPIAEAPRDGTTLLSEDNERIKYVVYEEWEGWIYEDENLSDYAPEPTHFRPLPDDRLARVTECLDDGYQTIIKHFPETEVLVNKIRQKANRIAEGKE